MHGRVTSNTLPYPTYTQNRTLPQSSRIHVLLRWTICSRRLAPTNPLPLEHVISFVGVPQGLVSDRAVSLLTVVRETLSPHLDEYSQRCLREISIAIKILSEHQVFSGHVQGRPLNFFWRKAEDALYPTTKANNEQAILTPT